MYSYNNNIHHMKNFYPFSISNETNTDQDVKSNVVIGENLDNYLSKS